MAMKQKNLTIEMKIKLLADVDKKLLPKKEELDEEACETETERTPEPDVSTEEAKAVLQQLLKQHEQGEKLFTLLMSAEDTIDELASQSKKQT